MKKSNYVTFLALVLTFSLFLAFNYYVSSPKSVGLCELEPKAFITDSSGGLKVTLLKKAHLHFNYNNEFAKVELINSNLTDCYNHALVLAQKLSTQLQFELLNKYSKKLKPGLSAPIKFDGTTLSINSNAQINLFNYTLLDRALFMKVVPYINWSFQDTKDSSFIGQVNSNSAKALPEIGNRLLDQNNQNISFNKRLFSASFGTLLKGTTDTLYLDLSKGLLLFD